VSGVISYVVEEQAPSGWTGSAISDSGVFDGNNRKVKWGPFFDDTSRTVGFEASGPAKGVPTRSKTNRGDRTNRWTGTLSIDGVNRAIHAE
jgi:hypothetical protein